MVTFLFKSEEKIVTIELTTLIAIVGCIIGIVGFIKGTKKDGKTDGQELASIKGNVDYIVRGIDDIRLEQKDQARKIDSQNERLIRNEESTKSAHKRIDKLEGNGHEN